MTFLKKLLPIFIFGTSLALVIFYSPPPTSLSSASFFQLITFSLPLLLLSVFLINLFINFFSKSLILGLGLTCLIILQGVSLLSFYTAPIIILATLFLARYFKKTAPKTVKKIPPQKILKKIEKAKPPKISRLYPS